MPTFMDRHDMADASPEIVAQAHMQDVSIQAKYGANFLTYWFDRDRQTTFCLVEAPDAESVFDAHREAHGDIPGEIIEVDNSTVEAFLGRIGDPAGSPDPIDEPAFRTIVFTDIAGSTEVHDRLGDEAALALLQRHNAVVRNALHVHGGREVKHTGDGIMACFHHATNALRAAIEMQQGFDADESEPYLDVRIGINAGEPIEDGDELYGLTVNLARRFCDDTDPRTIMTSRSLQSLTMGKGFEFVDLGDRHFKGISNPVPVCLVAWSQ